MLLVTEDGLEAGGVSGIELAAILEDKGSVRTFTAPWGLDPLRLLVAEDGLDAGGVYIIALSSSFCAGIVVEGKMPLGSYLNFDVEVTENNRFQWLSLFSLLF